MDKLRIGVIVYDVSDPLEGGGYSYYNTLLQGINSFEFNPQIEIINIVFYNNALTVALKKSSIFIKKKYNHEGELKDKVKRVFFRNRLAVFFSARNPVISFLSFLRLSASNKKIEQVLRDNKIDLIYYLKPEFLVLNYPFIATHWDVAHRSMHGFPETTLDNYNKIREDYFLYTLNKAFIIFCESESGAKELKDIYSIYDKKIKVLPIFGGNVINLRVDVELQKNILKKYNLEKEGYFLYPAQFWASKNHYNLILAFSKVVSEKKDLKLKLVLPGSDKGNMAYIKEVIKVLSLTDQVVIPGFVSDEDLFTFYKNAIALTMPTFLGPTNIPLIEAAHLKCAVLCSNFNGHKEILGDSALYFDPSSADSITEAMLQILSKDYRETLIDAAFLGITKSPFNLYISLNRLNQVLVQTTSIRKTWGIS